MTKQQKRMFNIIKKFNKYIATYDKQFGYLDYSDKTVIDDILYGIGAAFDEKYKFADGYKDWKEFLKNHLEKIIIST